ncbi:hypothetical protein [Bacillus sp. C28GYM-DRY-1]|uniref:hypothetical protein n=1 Tax=Bacillus sp. C28GYM-DRY-1 TaxID=3062686 RepID=UPI0026744D26|nr:hypothetical protein [Bacillus sp. C28GYM-DRY-1]MDO3662400.1 hypothetical protein [Bacillus sp. C28GYM-DRY-1]
MLTDTYQFDLKKTNEWLCGYINTNLKKVKPNDPDEVLYILGAMMMDIRSNFNTIEQLIKILDEEFSKRTDEVHPLLFAYTLHLYKRLGDSKSTFFHEGYLNMIRSLKEEYQKGSPSMIVYTLLAYFNLISTDELLVQLNNYLQIKDELLTSNEQYLEEHLEVLYTIAFLQLKDVQPYVVKRFQSSDYAYSGLMLAACRNYQIDDVAKYIIIMEYLQFDHDFFIEEGKNFLKFQQRIDGSFGYLNPLFIDKGANRLDQEYFLPMTHYAIVALSCTFKNASN